MIQLVSVRVPIIIPVHLPGTIGPLALVLVGAVLVLGGLRRRSR